MPRSRITGFFFVLCINYVNLPKDSDACKEIVSEKGQMEPYHSYHWRFDFTLPKDGHLSVTSVIQIMAIHIYS